jgi:phage tail-like protein
MASNDLQTSFYFSVKISGNSSSADAAFQEVTGLSKEMGTEDVVSGGENRFKYRLPAITTYPNLVLKRGIALIDSPLIEWCQITLDSGLGKPVQTQNIMLNLLNASGQASMSWSFVKAYPVKWLISDLKSQESNVLIETIEFAYQYFEVNDSRNNQHAGVASLFGDQ